MAFVSTFEVDPVGMTVPYPPLSDDIRRNRGFTDLRGRPDLAKAIVEGFESPTLGALLVRVANPTSTIFSVGCDLGTHRESANVSQNRREVAGGYIQIVGANYNQIDTGAYHKFAVAINTDVKSKVGTDNWKINFLGKWIDFKFDGEPNGLFPSLWIWFYAGGRTPDLAQQSRERLIEAINSALGSEEVLGALKPAS